MPFAAAISTQPQTTQALDEVCSRVAGPASVKPDLALVFFSPAHARQAETISTTLQERLEPRAQLGCIGEAVIGNDQEVEERPALSLWLAKWTEGATPRVEVGPFRLVLERTSEGGSLLGWPDALVGADPASSAMLVLGDPYSFPADFFLHQVNGDYAGLRVLGGMASGMTGPGECRLIGGGEVHEHGAVGVLLQGPIGLRSVVSQGCRPIGRHMVITRANDDIIFELGGRPPLQVLQELWHVLEPRDRELFQRGLHIGRVISEFQGEFRRGDFLVRNVRHLDRQTGALVLTDRVRVGQTVQFHVRDAETADEDLHALLRMDVGAHERRPAAALVFSCNGRGSRLFDGPDHDARTVRQEVGSIPLAGFFAAGELGPVGGQNFVHGFTASVALFEE
jgi:small ligand-binding sensory domain FIST